jgi:hypothetical protein
VSQAARSKLKWIYSMTKRWTISSQSAYSSEEFNKAELPDRTHIITWALLHTALLFYALPQSMLFPQCERPVLINNTSWKSTTDDWHGHIICTVTSTRKKHKISDFIRSPILKTSKIEFCFSSMKT